MKPTRDSLRRATEAAGRCVDCNDYEAPCVWCIERMERTALAIDAAVEARMYQIWHLLKHRLGPGTHQQVLNAVIDEVRAEYVAAVQAARDSGKGEA